MLLMRPKLKMRLARLFWEAYLCLIGVIVIPVVLIMVVLIFTPTLIWRPIAKILRPIFRPDLAGMLSCMSSVFAQVDNEVCPVKAMNVLEITVKGHLDLDEFIKHIHKTWISCRDDHTQNFRYPELQQYPVNWAGYKFWKWEENFSLQNHIRLATCGGDLTQMGLDLLCGSFPEGTSPWDLTIVPGPILQGEEAVTTIFMRMHHLLGDGFMVHFLLQRMWGDENPMPLFCPAVKGEKSFWNNAKASIVFPFKAALLFGELAHSAAKQWRWKVLERQKGLTWSLARGQSISTRTIFRIKKHFQVSFSAVLYSLVAGGLRRFMDSELKKGMKIPDVIQTVTPVLPGGKHPDRMGNQFSFGLTSYPTEISDPVERLYEMHNNFETLRHSAASVIGHYGFALLGSHVNWVAPLITWYPFGSLTTSYFPFGFSPEWNILGRTVSNATFYMKLQQGQQGGMMSISSFGDHVNINPLFNSNLLSSEEADKLTRCIVEEVGILEALNPDLRVISC
ncbi:uncharacterized protein LOC110854604 [Folsomia candida]|uniref:uncharacterized protein LOC110854604 n=1 Tax=Folsomia candida TaxID=158441 RepID=UPI0016053EBC|nr:uncharacterized protein LOC110854604 [Folsomia candida]